MSNTIECKLEIWAMHDDEAPDGFEMALRNPTDTFYVSSDRNVKVGMTTVTFMPPADMSREKMIQFAVETLRDKQRQIRARAEMEINKLEARIKELLLLTYQPEEDSPHDEVITADDTVVQLQPRSNDIL